MMLSPVFLFLFLLFFLFLLCLKHNPDIELVKNASTKSVDDKTKDLTELCGSWEDDRTAEEIIREIYDSRTSSQKEIDL